MDSAFQDSEFLFHNPLICLGNFLSDFVKALGFVADVKDARTGRYILGNKTAAELAGLTPSEYLGLDIFDIGKIIKLEKETIKSIVDADRQVKTNAQTLAFKHFFTPYSGFIRIEQTVKKPVFNQCGDKVIAIFNYTCDLTQQADPTYLFSLYKKHFPIKRAVKQFLKYLKIDALFRVMPTDQEVETLLAMRKNSAAKHVAKQLGICHKTVEAHKAHLREKLKKVIDLDELLAMLRVRNEYRDLCW